MNDHLKDVLMPVAVMGSFTVPFILFTRALTDYFVKKKMIEKGYVNDEAQSILKSQSDENKYTSLKWGLIIFFAGLSLILMEYIDFDRESPLPYGLFAVCVSLGFLVYYFLMKKDGKQ